MIKKRFISMLVLLCLTVSGAWAQEERLLTTILSADNADFKSGSKTFDNIATVTFSGKVYYDNGWGWWYSDERTLTVTAAEGYTITRVKFYTNNSSAFDEEAPFEAIVAEIYYEYITKVNGTSIGSYGVTKIEVYGYGPSKVSLKEGTEDASNWQGKAGEGEYQALPLKRVAAGTAVSVKYNGTKLVKRVNALKKATAEDKGKLIGTDGNLYADVAAATAAGTTAVAKIIYIDTYRNGLALALTDEGWMDWWAAGNACSAKNTSTPVTGATWLLASKDQWEYMMGADGAGSSSALRDGFSSVGGSNLQSDHQGLYWSSTEYSSYEKWCYVFDDGHWGYNQQSNKCWARACLAFGALKTVTLNHSANNTWAIAEMPDDDVELEVEYFNITVPTANTADIYAGTTTPLINAGSTTEGATMKYLVTATNEQPTSTDGFSTDVPTAEGRTAGTYYVWYYLDFASGADSDISALAVEVTVKAIDVTMKRGTEDATSWQGKAGTGEYQALPLEDVALGTAVSVKYNGTKKVKSVKAKKAAAAPALNLTSPAVGQVIGDNGENYDYASLPGDVTAVAKICYVSGSNGLALALTDEGGSMTWNTAKTTCAAHRPAFYGGTWKLATQDEWNNMITAAGGYEALRDGFSSVGGSDLLSMNYWSSTEYEADPGLEMARCYDFDNGNWGGTLRDIPFCLARACLVFFKTLAEATPSDCGKVVCAAGHLHDAKTAVPSECTAVGILGKVTETGHGLILSLWDAPFKSWHTINSWTSVTTYAGTTLKQLPDDGALGPLTSYTTLGSTAVSDWCVAQKSDYEAIFTNLGSTTGGQNGLTYDANVNAYITTGVGGAGMYGDFWSATKYDWYGGWYFGSSCWYFNDKDYGLNGLRPVLGFGAQGPDPIELTSTDGETWTLASMPDNDVELEVEYYDEVTLTDGSAITALNDYTEQEIWVNYTRSFTEGKTSTVCLPFAYTKKEGDGSFYAFTNIEKEGGEYVATMTEPAATTLTANTPYLYLPNATGDVDFGGAYTIPAELTAGSTTSNGWTFKGTFETITWTTAPTGVYGFSAQAVDGISQGEFVKVGEYVRVKPMRCYLENESFAGARGTNRAAEQLPETIKVRLISANSEVNAIGTISTKTGEGTIDNGAWYSLDGRRIEGKPSTKGVYINNGNKVVIK